LDSRRERRKDRRGLRHIAVDPDAAVQARRHRFAMTLEVGGKPEDSAIVVPNDLVNHEATRRLVAWLRRKSRVSRAIEWISLCAFVSSHGEGHPGNIGEIDRPAGPGSERPETGDDNRS